MAGRQRCHEFGGQAVVRDDEGQPLRNPDNTVMLRPCNGFIIKGSDPPRCLVHLSGNDARRRAQDKESAYIARHWGQLNQLLEGADFPDLDPMNALLEVVRHTGTMMRVLQLLVAELPVEPGYGYVETEFGEQLRAIVPGLYGHDKDGEQAPHVFVNLLAIWTDRHMKACKMALDAGIDERIVRNAESTTERLFSAFTLALRQVALTDEVRQQLGRAFASEVRKAIDVPSQEVGS